MFAGAPLRLSRAAAAAAAASPPLPATLPTDSCLLVDGRLQVNNAGMADPHMLPGQPSTVIDHWEAVIATNLTGAHGCALSSC